MNKFIIGSFATTNTPYVEILEKTLEPTLQKLSLPYEFLYIANKGSWWNNVAEKPKCIKELLLAYKDQIDLLVFVDADAEIVQYPKLFETIPEEYDIGFHMLEWESWYGYKGNKTKELLTGTMFFRCNDRVITFLDDWYNQAKLTNIWEQIICRKVLDKHPIKWYNMPIQYCYMKTRPNGKEPLIKCEPVIIHHQVSRKLKRIIK